MRAFQCSKCKQLERKIQYDSGYPFCSEYDCSRENAMEDAKKIAIDIVRKGGVVAKNATVVHTCENCDKHDYCDYHHYSGKDWKEYIGIECDEWKEIKEGDKNGRS